MVKVIKIIIEVTAIATVFLGIIVHLITFLTAISF